MLGLYGEASEIEAFAEAFRDHEKTVALEQVSSLDGDGATYYTGVIEYGDGHPISSFVEEHGCFQHDTVTVQRGIENWTVYADQQTDVIELISDVESDGNDLVSYRSVDVDEIDGEMFSGYESLYNQLTAAQRRTFSAALNAGYYDRESDLTIEDVANNLDLHHTTVWEQLDEVERKIMANVGTVLFGPDT